MVNLIFYGSNKFLNYFTVFHYLFHYFLQVVYVTRNVKDQLISNMHHHKNIMFHGYTGGIDTFISYFTRGLCKYTLILLCMVVDIFIYFIIITSPAPAASLPAQ